MNTLMTLTYLVCGVVNITVLSEAKPMNDFDYTEIQRARQQCGVFYPKSPCVKQFIKVGDREYRVICGKEGN